VIGRAARKLGQPMVVAEITAGILLGPSVLGWLLPGVWAGLFAPESLELLHLVSNLGLVLFMFLIGLEFDPQLSRERVRAALLTSQAGLAIPLLLGVLLAFHLHAEYSEASVSRGAFALFLGVVLSLSAFPVMARILAERRLLRSRVGVVTITCAAIDDVIAWCLAAFVIAWARAKGLAEALSTTALAVAYVAAMILLVRPLLERLARRFSSSTELGHDRIAAVMLLLFASSWATAMIGIHAMFGAFLFGAILPRDGGFAHALADKLEDVVIVVLLPLFFAYSGVRTQISLLDSARPRSPPGSRG
jgi:Kef-type K+ transport system membrane component KefB